MLFRHLTSSLEAFYSYIVHYNLVVAVHVCSMYHDIAFCEGFCEYTRELREVCAEDR